jgi:outer membrane protein OmpU
MNNLKKIGLSALAGSLVAFSANAGEMTVTGGAQLFMSSSDKVGKTTFSNSDHVNFDGSTELDNGMTVSFNLQLDGDEADDGAIDNHSITVNTNGMGTFVYAGHGGDSAMSAMDDKTPTAYEEAFDSLGGTSAVVINGYSGNDLIGYTSEDFNGVTFKATLMPSIAETTTQHSGGAYTDFGIIVKPSMVDGLEIGYAAGTTEVTAGTEVDESTVYATYAVGSLTLGYQMSDYDAPSSTDSDESSSVGVSYAVNDNLSISYNEHTVDVGSSSDDQESKGFSVSYTTGGLTLAGHKNEMDNVGGSSSSDKEGYEINLGFAF